MIAEVPGKTPALGWGLAVKLLRVLWSMLPTLVSKSRNFNGKRKVGDLVANVMLKLVLS